jgi:hypothetical protein
MRGRFGPSTSLLAIALAAPLLGCSDDSKRPNAEKNPVCNDLINDGPEVRYVTLPDLAPTPEGGTIAPGAYELSALTLYSASSAVPEDVVSAVMTVGDDTMQHVTNRQGEETRYTSTFETSDTNLTITDTCPAKNVNTVAYTATASELRMSWDASGEVFELTFRKR